MDFFTPIVDDPYLFGRIAAANALSDVYAMGGKPLLAMNLVAFPSKKLDLAILKEILRGGLDTLNEAGALLVGGHSIEDDEIKYGLSLTGTVHPNQVLLNSGAQPGDQLLLTKPIGTGILATAIKGGLAGDDTEKMIGRVMAYLNRQAAQALAGSGAHACTDITGFGLIGHLYEMAAASGVAIELRAAAVPLLPEVLHFAAMGIIPEGAHNNRCHYRRFVNCALPGENDPLEIVMYDPQTSGGLLIAAAPKDIAAIAARLSVGKYPFDFGIIGEVLPAPPGRISMV